ncbi:hypothetical protein [Bacillus cereus]|uniref:hypothetical protein n=1 Tax=Bacillus cereus TaxID=1396 RepID=UPI001145F94C|nr:hypothetical protein [Bacillus cereus]
MRIPMYKRVHALYKGDQFLTEGTLLEISERTNRSLAWLQHMLTPTYVKKRKNSTNCLRLYLLDDED